MKSSHRVLKVQCSVCVASILALVAGLGAGCESHLRVGRSPVDGAADGESHVELPDGTAGIPGTGGTVSTGGVGMDGAGGTTTVVDVDAAVGGATSAADGAAGTGGSTVQARCSDPDDFAAKAVTTGLGHTCALTRDGGARCWGSNFFGQLGDDTTTDHPTPRTTDVLSGVQAVAAGGLHTCALMTTGGVRCWGRNDFGQLGDGTTTDRSTPPTTDVLGDVQAIAAGGNSTCALMKTGGIRCWGDHEHVGGGPGTYRATPPTTDDLTGVQAVVVGEVHTCALMKTSGVRCWGRNDSGQLGDGTLISWTPPTTDVLSGVQAIAVGKEHTCALMATGGVRCWGNGSTIPPASDELNGVQAIAAGANHTCALMTAGGVRCWGDNTIGQLGDGTTTDRSTPPVTDILGGVQAIVSGGNHTCALMIAGGIRCWGNNYSGELGDGTTLNRATPPGSDVLTGAQAIAAGELFSCALTTAGGVRCWGWNVASQLGDGTTTERLTPPTTDVLNGVQAIATGSGHSCALMTTGGVRCWGGNAYGQLGDGTTNGRTTPQTDDTLRGVHAIAAGGNHMCALMTSGGGVRCWGYNKKGQLGDGTTANRTAPPAADVLAGVQAIAAGAEHSCAVMTTGGVRCWGDNKDGQLGDGTTTNRAAPPVTDVLTDAQAISAGEGHTCALSTTGGVRCWGDNSFGQLGDGTTNDRASPPAADVLTNVQAISAGDRHTCALMKTTGGVRCWGHNNMGQLGDGTTEDHPMPPASDVLTGVQAISAGTEHTCALLTTGGVRCWGRNDQGQLGDGNPGFCASPVPVLGVCSVGMLELVAGKLGGPGDLDGVGAAARFRSPHGVAADRAGRLFAADGDILVIRQIEIATGAVTTLAGSPNKPGSSDGAGPAARFNNPGGVVTDGAGNLFVVDSDNSTIRKVNIATGAVTTLAGSPGSHGSTDGTGAAARFGLGVSSSVASDGAGNLFVADSDNNTIRRVDLATGAVTTLAGSAGSSGSTDGTGPAARFNGPVGVACDGSGNLFVGERHNNAIRKVDIVTGVVTTLSISPRLDSPDGTEYFTPHAIACDGAGYLFVADTQNHTIRQIAIATGAVTTLAGSPGIAGSSDGTGTAARFHYPLDVASDGSGNLFVTDNYNATIRKIAIATGAVTTLAGSPERRGSTDGTGSAARFGGPTGIASDGSGNLFVADGSNATIRKVVIATGAVTTLAGSPGIYGSSCS